jgi:Mor transcription activator family
MANKLRLTKPTVHEGIPALDAGLLQGVPASLLPPMALAVVQACGADAAARLLMWQPGARICVPKVAEREHVLAEVMGWAGYRGLVARYGDQRIALPRCEKLFRALRNAAVVRAYGQGATVNELAVRYGMGARHVETVLAAPGMLDVDVQLAGGLGSLSGALVDSRQMALAL